MRALRVHDKQIGCVERLRVRPRAVAVEDDPAPVGRQGGESVVGRVFRKASRLCAIPIHQVDLGRAEQAHGVGGRERCLVARADECDGGTRCLAGGDERRDQCDQASEPHSLRSTFYALADHFRGTIREIEHSTNHLANDPRQVVEREGTTLRHLRTTLGSRDWDRNRRRWLCFVAGRAFPLPRALSFTHGIPPFQRPVLFSRCSGYCAPWIVILAAALSISRRSSGRRNRSRNASRQQRDQGSIAEQLVGARASSPRKARQYARRLDAEPPAHFPAPQSLYGSNSSAPAMTTISGRSVCNTSTVAPCASSTSGRRRYTCGLSSVPPPRSSTPFFCTHSCIISREIAPGFSTLPLRVRVPAAAVRLMTRPAPCTVE